MTIETLITLNSLTKLKQILILNISDVSKMGLKHIKTCPQIKCTYYPFKRQPHKMVKLTQRNRQQQLFEQLFECLTILWGWRLQD